jgi:hypothetical protein
MGRDVACEAEAAKPTNGRKFRNYRAAHVQRSESSQIIAESDHINDVTHAK